MTQETIAPPQPTGMAGMVEDRPDLRFFRINRASLVDKSVFEAEQRAIFDRCWLYVGHTSENPAPGDYRAARSRAGR